MKKAFFVMGPESSGTRMLTRAFMSVGVFGDDGDRQRLDEGGYYHVGDIVFRRSIPYAGKWPPIGDLCRKMGTAGYEVQPIVILRDREITARSQVRNGHTGTVEEARGKVDQAVSHIGTELALVVDRELMKLVTYESFVAHEGIRMIVFASLGLPGPAMEFYNGNEKYLSPEEAT